jgi:RNA polymerase sigma factor (sigma-70 family)
MLPCTQERTDEAEALSRQAARAECGPTRRWPEEHGQMPTPSPQPPRAGELVEALERQRHLLKRLLAAFRLSPEDAEDLLQDLAVLAVRKSAEIQNLDHWLLATARNLCLMRARKRNRVWLPLEEQFDQVSLHEPERLDLYMDLDKALADLTEAQRNSLVLRAMGFTLKEVSLRLGCATSKVPTLLKRGAARVTTRLDE